MIEAIATLEFVYWLCKLYLYGFKTDIFLPLEKLYNQVKTGFPNPKGYTMLLLRMCPFRFKSFQNQQTLWLDWEGETGWWINQLRCPTSVNKKLIRWTSFKRLKKTLPLHLYCCNSYISAHKINCRKRDKGINNRENIQKEHSKHIDRIDRA